LKLAREQKAAEQAQKKAKREAKQLERQQTKEAKVATAIKRKKEQRKGRDDTIAAAVTAASKKRSKRASIKSSKTGQKRSIQPKTVTIQTTKAAKRAPSAKKAATVNAVAMVTVAIAEAEIRSRSGRTIARPARFEG
jgi:hypothetical protein